MLLNQYILVLFATSILCAQDVISVANEGEKKDIIYLKDGTFLECDIINTGFYLADPSFYSISPYISCGKQNVEYEQIEKIIYADGGIKFEGEIISSRNKIKFWYYITLTSIIVGLTLLVS